MGDVSKVSNVSEMSNIMHEEGWLKNYRSVIKVVFLFLVHKYSVLPAVPGNMNIYMYISQRVCQLPL